MSSGNETKPPYSGNVMSGCATIGNGLPPGVSTHGSSNVPLLIVSSVPNGVPRSNPRKFQMCGRSMKRPQAARTVMRPSPRGSHAPPDAAPSWPRYFSLTALPG